MISLRARIARGILSALVQQKGKGDQLYGLPEPTKPEPAYVPPKGFRWRRQAVGQAHVEVLEGSRPDAVVFNIHGGGFVEGMTNARRRMAAEYSKAAQGAAVISPNYRVSPEVVHPAALEDCAMKGASHGFNLYRDPMFGRPKKWLPTEPVPERRLYYTGQWDLFDPCLSLLYGDLHGLPPMLLQTGTWEILSSAIRWTLWRRLRRPA